MPVDVEDPRVLDLVAEDVELELLGSGYAFSEGPLWIPEQGCLLFSDVFASKRFRWVEGEGAAEIATDTEMGNGMTLDLEGRLLVCESTSRALARMDATGTGSGREVLADRYDGRRLNSPNDVVVRKDGTIYFTDPWSLQLMQVDAEQELDFAGVYRLGADGPELLLDDLEFPNGLCFSPDESILYVNDSFPGTIRALDVSADGSVSGDRLFAEVGRDSTGSPDGMKCDEHGNVWVTAPGGIAVLDPDGAHLGTVQVPPRAANFHWGGPDWSWVFVTASTGVYRFRTKTHGRQEPFMS